MKEQEKELHHYFTPESSGSLDAVFGKFCLCSMSSIARIKELSDLVKTCGCLAEVGICEEMTFPLCHSDTSKTNITNAANACSCNTSMQWIFARQCSVVVDLEQHDRMQLCGCHRQRQLRGC